MPLRILNTKPLSRGQLNIVSAIDLLHLLSGRSQDTHTVALEPGVGSPGIGGMGRMGRIASCLFPIPHSPFPIPHSPFPIPQLNNF
ncbi:hypothetical protein [Roseofilum capinflatum]|uniref:Uncharacterized protein n=1 Tax=Roseofilum capinflatum BLCC-M114 TaxID=3022440 RepID=A0ABT7BCU1_9CYAN|nr:hypothetical protein [Roseofilum capinflatum]MDJ1176995.1 hypothetical protein [Roseofilum capinflatum BLCC-M114]